MKSFALQRQICAGLPLFPPPNLKKRNTDSTQAHAAARARITATLFCSLLLLSPSFALSCLSPSSTPLRQDERPELQRGGEECASPPRLCLWLQRADPVNGQIEIWKVKKLIKRLEAARGNGTSMISLIIRMLHPLSPGNPKNEWPAPFPAAPFLPMLHRLTVCLFLCL